MLYWAWLPVVLVGYYALTRWAPPRLVKTTSLLLALPVMTVAWFFTLQPDGRPSQRFGPYLTEGTCEAVRTRVVGRAQRPSDASVCFKVIVQENDQLGE